MSESKDDKGITSDTCGCSCKKCKLNKCQKDENKCCGGAC